MKYLFSLGIMSLLLLSASTSSAQSDKSKRPSPPATVTQKVGDATIVIDYSQPSVKGRTIGNGSEGTIIFNKTWKQWGAFKYSQADDQLRVTGKAEKAKTFAEKMTFSISPAGKVSLWWGDNEVSFKVK